MNPLTVRPAFANSVNLSESQFLSLLFREFAASELVKMPSDGTYKAAKVYQLAKRLGLPVVGTSYTSFGDDQITRKKAAQIIAQAFTGKLYTEKESVEWLYQQKLYVNTQMTYEAFAPDETLTKENATEFVIQLKQLGFTKLLKTANGKMGQYRVDAFSMPIATYKTYEQAYNHAKKYTYTKVIDTSTGMVLWYPKNNTRIFYHLFANGKWAAGFDTKANAIAYANKLENYQSRIRDGIRNQSVWDNYDRYIVKSPEGYEESFRSIDDAYNLALKYDGIRSYIHPINDDVNQYTNSFLSQEAAGIGNGVIIFNGYEIDRKKDRGGNYEPGYNGQYPKDFFKPYIAYQKNGKFVDRFFDTFIVSGRLYSETGRFEETPENQANYQEWNWYKERTLQPGGVVDRLNEDAASFPEIDKVKVYVALPYPKDVGIITKLDGTPVYADYANRLDLVKWYVEQMLTEFNSGKFSHIQFEGFYWLNETVISKEDEKLVSDVSNFIHSYQKRFIFSPHANATNYKNWKKYGFDAAYFQSNAKNATDDPVEFKKRLHWGFMNSYQYGMGVNLEMEDIAFSAIDSLKQAFDPYMEFGQRYGMKRTSTIMYQGTVMMHRLGTAKTKMYKDQYLDYYDKIYQFLRGDK
ncbi:MAG TPA: DUF4855 domain-containing protein [Pseudoneobacillus sp.]|nr:DUF4855 domain-containing protein [Pseudoneobacillus sp.]